MDEIEKYIKYSLKKNSPEDVRKELASKGYNPEDYDYVFNKISLEKKRRIIYRGILLTILLLAILVRLLILNPIIDESNITEKVYSDEPIFLPKIISYSTDPKDWIENNTISVEASTNGTGVLTSESVQYLTEDLFSEFIFDGYYQGEYFKKGIEGKIEITNNFDPDDGILQILLVNKLEDNISKVLIFLDEDWRRKIVPTSIWWGINYENNKMFNFNNEISRGVYLDTIDDSDRFVEGFNVHFGGVAVGDITQNKIDNDEANVTFVRIR